MHQLKHIDKKYWDLNYKAFVLRTLIDESVLVKQIYPPLICNSMLSYLSKQNGEENLIYGNLILPCQRAFWLFKFIQGKVSECLEN